MINKIIDKLLSGRWLAMMCLVITVCIGFLKELISPEFFAAIVSGSLTGYAMKARKNETNLSSNNKSDS